MRIKTSKQMRLDELIKYIFDNGIEDKSFTSCNQLSPMNDDVRVSGSGNIKINGYINKNTLFTVEVEEELTEDTVIDVLNMISKSGMSKVIHEDVCVSIDDMWTNFNYIDETPEFIYRPKENGDMTLIWTKDAGIPTEGTLEL